MTADIPAEHKLSFLEELHEQRWDDHRYYHHSYINQSLHLVSALCFLTAYVAIWFNPIVAATLGWICAMVSRQIGHFFFEPKSYDEINKATHEHKEDIKVGYNLRRKVVLLTAWAATPFLLWWQPTMFGLFTPATDTYSFIYNLSWMWLILGGIALVARTVHLMVVFNPQRGLVWFTKILTDPFHDVKIYHKAPLKLLQGERLDPMTDWPSPKGR